MYSSSIQKVHYTKLCIQPKSALYSTLHPHKKRIILCILSKRGLYSASSQKEDYTLNPIKKSTILWILSKRELYSESIKKRIILWILSKRELYSESYQKEDYTLHPIKTGILLCMQSKRELYSALGWSDFSFLWNFEKKQIGVVTFG